MNKKIIHLIIIGMLLCLSGLSAQDQEYMRPVNGPQGVNARSIAIHPDGSLFICTQEGSYYRSVDEGQTWQFRSKQNSSSDPLIVAGWGDIFAGSSRIYRSRDQAKTWEYSDEGLPSTSILSLLYNPQTNELLAGTYNDGIYISSDSGATWHASNTGMINWATMRITSLYRHTNGNLYATQTNYSDGYVYCSTDNGASWGDISGGISGSKTFTAVVLTEDNRIFVSNWEGDVFRSDDAGVTWNNFNSGITDDYIETIASPSGGIVLIGTTYGGIFRSENYGASWTQLGEPGLYGISVWDIKYDPAKNKTYASLRNTGIFSADQSGLNWQPQNNGLNHVEIEDLILTENGNLFACGWGEGVYRSPDGGDNWKHLPLGTEPLSARSLTWKPGYIFAGTMGKGVFYSTDKGDTWQQGGAISNPGFIVSMVTAQTGEILAGNTNGLIFRSIDDGQAWTQVYDAGDEITAFTVNPHNGYIFAAVDDATDGGVYRSVDGGLNWTKESTNLGSYRIRCLAVSPLEPVIYAGTAGNGIFFSDDDGKSWSALDAAGLSTWIDPLLVTATGEIFAGGSNLYRSQDGGATFEPLSIALDKNGFNVMLTDAQQYLYIGTYGMSVWRSIRPTTARSLTFSVKMKYEDGFDSSSGQVEVHGPFNDWGNGDTWALSAAGDEDITYSGTFSINDARDVITDGRLDYKFAIPPDQRELFSGYRSVGWDGLSDLVLDTVWYSNQKQFTRMTTTALSIDQFSTRGCAWADFDNDGDEDLFVTHEGGTLANDLYINNLEGNFSKLTSGPLATDIADSRGAVWGDFNNDGWLDLYVCNADQNNILYKNDGNGNFVRVDDGATTINSAASVSAVWADFDQDGFLDLFVANSNEENNFLYRNNGDETFTPLTSGKIVSDGGSSLGCAAADFDNDGDMDLFVANKHPANSGAVNFLYRNDGNWTFTRITSGPVAEDADDSGGASWGDVDNDGWLDLFVTNINNEPNRLYLNDKTGGFLPAATEEMTADSSTSLGSAWMDINNDGWLDLFVTNAAYQLNTFYLNKGDGYLSKRYIGPLVQDPVTNSRSAAWADYDRDGDADLFVSNSGQSNALYRNNQEGGTWLQIRLEGLLPNSTVIGAQVIVKTKLANEDRSVLLQKRTVEAQSGLTGQNSPVLQFGMRQETMVDSIIIIWPDGLVETKLSYTTNQLLSFRQKLPPAKVTLKNPANNAGGVPVPPTLSWNLTAEASKYWMRVSESATFSPLIRQDSTLTATSLVLNEAAFGKTYYWQVRAGNQAGWGEWSEVWKFTTGSAASPPPAPELNSPADGATGISLPPVLSWFQAGNATQYYLQVASNNSFTSSTLMEDDSSVTDLSYQVSGLTYNTTYFWRVSARNTSGWGDWSEGRSFTTEILTQNPDPPLPEDPPNGQSKMAIPALLSWRSASAGNFIVEVGTDQAVSNIVFSQTVSENYVFADGLAHSTTYYWHVKIVVNSLESTWSTTFSFTTYDANIQVTNRTFSFPSHTRRDEFSAQDYILFGLPGHADKLLNEVLGSDEGETWTAYWDDGTSSTAQDYFIPYDGTDKFRLHEGAGFWLIHNGSLTVNETLPIAALNADAKAEIPVHEGFNIITCPFDVPVDWEEVLYANDLPLDIKLWRRDETNKSFKETSSLEPYRGYYIFLQTVTSQILQIPYMYPQPVSTKPRAHLRQDSNLLWQARITLQSGEFTDRSTCFGTAPDAKDGLDSYEYRKPRAPGNMPDIYFNRPQWDKAYQIFAADIRPEISDMAIWDFKVDLPRGRKATLSLENMESVPELYEVYLIDQTHRQFRNLRAQSAYDFVAALDQSDFELVVGEQAAIDQKLKEVLPQTFSLGQNYPNPFNPVTTIPLTLPEQAELTLRIFNLLGQEIATLYKGKLPAGIHYFNWDGKNSRQKQMPSGVYIYQLRVNNGERFTGKMVLIK